MAEHSWFLRWMAVIVEINKHDLIMSAVFFRMGFLDEDGLMLKKLLIGLLVGCSDEE